MAIPALQTLVERIETWPVERQERAVELLTSLDAGSPDDDWHLSKDDVEEIERRVGSDEIRLDLPDLERRLARLLK